MKTLVLKNNRKDLKKAGQIIRDGGLVAFPTETVYGLGANALDKDAAKKIYKAKGRPSDNPLIVHITAKKEVYKLAKNISKKALLLMDKFWPGPLTLVLEKKAIVPKEVTGGLDTVAIRVPKNQVALKFIRQAGVPIAAPSANVSGKPSPTDAKHVKTDLGGRIDAIIDSGKAAIGLESTVLDMTTDIPTILRPGGITLEQLEKVLGKSNVTLFRKIGKKKVIARSPGMKYRHYAPVAPVILIEGERNLVKKKIIDLTNIFRKEKKIMGILTLNSCLLPSKDISYISVKDGKQFAQRLFASLRYFDEIKVDIILVEGISESDIGLAVMNRLRKAASEIIYV